MKIETTYLEDHQAKLSVSVDPQVLEDAKHRAAKKIARQTKIPGFRPGKAPYPIVVRTVGEETILQEAMDLLLEDIYPQIIKESGIKAWGPGMLNEISSMEPPTFQFTVPLDAEVTLGDYKSIRIPYELTPVTDEDVEQTIEDIQDRYATFEPVDRAAQDGDQVSLRLSAERKTVQEGQPVALINDRPSALTINPEDEDNPREWPFPGFSRHLVGLKAGDEHTFEYTYPEDSVLENLRGTEAIFRIKVEAVKLRQIPELNDEFATKLGEFKTMDEVRKEVRSGLEEQRKTDYNQDYHNQILNQIIASSVIKYPPQMLEQEVDVFYRQLQNRLAQQNLDMATYLKTRQMDEKALREELKPSAEERLKRSLVIYEVAQAEEIQVKEDEVQSETLSTLNQINQSFSPQEARKMVNQEFIQNMVGNITSDLLVRHTLDRLAAIAKGEMETSTEGAPEGSPEEPSTSSEVPQPSTEKAKKPKTRKKPASKGKKKEE